MRIHVLLRALSLLLCTRYHRPGALELPEVHALALGLFGLHREPWLLSLAHCRAFAQGLRIYNGNGNDDINEEMAAAAGASPRPPASPSSPTPVGALGVPAPSDWSGGSPSLALTTQTGGNAGRGAAAAAEAVSRQAFAAVCYAQTVRAYFENGPEALPPPTNPPGLAAAQESAWRAAEAAAEVAAAAQESDANAAAAAAPAGDNTGLGTAVEKSGVGGGNDGHNGGNLSSFDGSIGGVGNIRRSSKAAAAAAATMAGPSSAAAMVAAAARVELEVELARAFERCGQRDALWPRLPLHVQDFLATPAFWRDARERFRALDADEDGCLSPLELLPVVCEVTGASPSESVQRTNDGAEGEEGVDADGNTLSKLSELSNQHDWDGEQANILQGSERAASPADTAAGTTFDTDASPNDNAAADGGVTLLHCTRFLACFDYNGDGVLSLAEFASLLRFLVMAAYLSDQDSKSFVSRGGIGGGLGSTSLSRPSSRQQSADPFFATTAGAAGVTASALLPAMEETLGEECSEPANADEWMDGPHEPIAARFNKEARPSTPLDQGDSGPSGFGDWGFAGNFTGTFPGDGTFSASAAAPSSGMLAPLSDPSHELEAHMRASSADPFQKQRQLMRKIDDDDDEEVVDEFDPEGGSVEGMMVPRPTSPFAKPRPSTAELPGLVVDGLLPLPEPRLDDSPQVELANPLEELQDGFAVVLDLTLSGESPQAFAQFGRSGQQLSWVLARSWQAKGWLASKSSIVGVGGSDKKEVENPDDENIMDELGLDLDEDPVAAVRASVLDRVEVTYQGLEVNKNNGNDGSSNKVEAMDKRVLKEVDLGDGDRYWTCQIAARANGFASIGEALAFKASVEKTYWYSEERAMSPYSQITASFEASNDSANNSKKKKSGGDVAPFKRGERLRIHRAVDYSVYVETTRATLLSPHAGDESDASRLIAEAIAEKRAETNAQRHASEVLLSSEEAKAQEKRETELTNLALAAAHKTQLAALSAVKLELSGCVARREQEEQEVEEQSKIHAAQAKEAFTALEAQYENTEVEASTQRLFMLSRATDALEDAGWAHEADEFRALVAADAAAHGKAWMDEQASRVVRQAAEAAVAELSLALQHEGRELQGQLKASARERARQCAVDVKAVEQAEERLCAWEESQRVAKKRQSAAPNASLLPEVDGSGADEAGKGPSESRLQTQLAQLDAKHAEYARMASVRAAHANARLARKQARLQARESALAAQATAQAKQLEHRQRLADDLATLRVQEAAALLNALNALPSEVQNMGPADRAAAVAAATQAVRAQFTEKEASMKEQAAAAEAAAVTAAVAEAGKAEIESRKAFKKQETQKQIDEAQARTDKARAKEKKSEKASKKRSTKDKEAGANTKRAVAQPEGTTSRPRGDRDLGHRVNASSLYPDDWNDDAVMRVDKEDGVKESSGSFGSEQSFDRPFAGIHEDENSLSSASVFSSTDGGNKADMLDSALTPLHQDGLGPFPTRKSQQEIDAKIWQPFLRNDLLAMPNTPSLDSMDEIEINKNALKASLEVDAVAAMDAKSQTEDETAAYRQQLAREEKEREEAGIVETPGEKEARESKENARLSSLESAMKNAAKRADGMMSRLGNFMRFEEVEEGALKEKRLQHASKQQELSAALREAESLKIQRHAQMATLEREAAAAEDTKTQIESETAAYREQFAREEKEREKAGIVESPEEKDAREKKENAHLSTLQASLKDATQRANDVSAQLGDFVRFEEKMKAESAATIAALTADVETLSASLANDEAASARMSDPSFSDNRMTSDQRALQKEKEVAVKKKQKNQIAKKQELEMARKEAESLKVQRQAQKTSLEGEAAAAENAKSQIENETAAYRIQLAREEKEREDAGVVETPEEKEARESKENARLSSLESAMKNAAKRADDLSTQLSDFVQFEEKMEAESAATIAALSADVESLSAILANDEAAPVTDPAYSGYMPPGQRASLEENELAVKEKQVQQAAWKQELETARQEAASLKVQREVQKASLKEEAAAAMDIQSQIENETAAYRKQLALEAKEREEAGIIETPEEKEARESIESARLSALESALRDATQRSDAAASQLVFFVQFEEKMEAESAATIAALALDIDVMNAALAKDEEALKTMSDPGYGNNMTTKQQLLLKELEMAVKEKQAQEASKKQELETARQEAESLKVRRQEQKTSLEGEAAAAEDAKSQIENETAAYRKQLALEAKEREEAGIIETPEEKEARGSIESARLSALESALRDATQRSDAAASQLGDFVQFEEKMEAESAATIAALALDIDVMNAALAEEQAGLAILSSEIDDQQNDNEDLGPATMNYYHDIDSARSPSSVGSGRSRFSFLRQSPRQEKELAVKEMQSQQAAKKHELEAAQQEVESLRVQRNVQKSSLLLEAASAKDVKSQIESEVAAYREQLAREAQQREEAGIVETPNEKEARESIENARLSALEAALNDATLHEEEILAQLRDFESAEKRLEAESAATLAALTTDVESISKVLAQEEAGLALLPTQDEQRPISEHASSALQHSLVKEIASAEAYATLAAQRADAAASELAAANASGDPARIAAAQSAHNAAQSASTAARSAAEALQEGLAADQAWTSAQADALKLFGNDQEGAQDEIEAAWDEATASLQPDESHRSVHSGQGGGGFDRDFWGDDGDGNNDELDNNSFGGSVAGSVADTLAGNDSVMSQALSETSSQAAEKAYNATLAALNEEDKANATRIQMQFRMRLVRMWALEGMALKKRAANLLTRTLRHKLERLDAQGEVSELRSAKEEKDWAASLLQANARGMAVRSELLDKLDAWEDGVYDEDDDDDDDDDKSQYHLAARYRIGPNGHFDVLELSGATAGGGGGGGGAGGSAGNGTGYGKNNAGGEVTPSNPLSAWSPASTPRAHTPVRRDPLPAPDALLKDYSWLVSNQGV